LFEIITGKKILTFTPLIFEPNPSLGEPREDTASKNIRIPP